MRLYVFQIVFSISCVFMFTDLPYTSYPYMAFVLLTVLLLSEYLMAQKMCATISEATLACFQSDCLSTLLTRDLLFQEQN